MVSGLALYGLIADGEAGAEVYACAGDKDQARIVFREARDMVEADTDLNAICATYRDAIEVRSSNSVFRVVSSDAKLRQGLNPSLVLFDELHVQPNEDLWTAMTQGSGTRRQPLVIAITTAGYDEESLCYRLYEYGRKVLAGEIDDPTFFFRWWAAKFELDYRGEDAWREANPMFDDTLKPDDFEAQARITQEHEFRRYRLNQWTPSNVAWLPNGAWKACEDQSLELDPALPLAVGIDVGLRHDSSAVVAAQKQGDRTVLRARIWENPYAPNDPQHENWKLNIAEVEAYLLELFEKFPVPAVEIDDEIRPGPVYDYDPMFFERSADLLEGEQLAMVEYPQNDTRMIAASQAFYELIVTGQIAHDGDPAFARHVNNAIADQKTRGWRISKPKGSKKKIDAAIAGAIAAWQAQQAPPTPQRSVYEDRGLLRL